MEFFVKLDDDVLEKINKIKEEIKNEQKEIYSILLEITKSFSDDEKDKKYRDLLFERVDLLNIIIKENNKKINDLKNGEYKENFNSVIIDSSVNNTIAEVEDITNELKELEEIRQEEIADDITKVIEDEEKNVDNVQEILLEEEIIIENKDEKEIKKVDLKKELEDIIKEVNISIQSEDIIEKVPVLFSTSSYTNSNSRRANTQLMVREEKNSFSDRLKGVFIRIKSLIIK